MASETYGTTERQRDRQTDGWIDTQADIQMHRKTERMRDRLTDRLFHYTADSLCAIKTSSFHEKKIFRTYECCTRIIISLLSQSQKTLLCILRRPPNQ